MSIGTGLFLSALLLAAVLLYGFTKDRWRWRLIIAVGTTCCIALLALAAFGLIVLDRKNQESGERRHRADRLAHQVAIGDHYKTVLQRQGRPDTAVVMGGEGFVIAYWEDYESVAEANKVFIFTPDSLLTQIRFIGRPYDRIEYGWIPEDRVTLGTSRDFLFARLGQPCREELDQERTLYVFRTADTNITRFASVSHGAAIVIRHGWSRDQCDR